MPRPPKPLIDLFRVLFPSNAQLREFLSNYDYLNAQDLVDELPDAPATPPAEYRPLAARQVQIHGIDNAHLFGELDKKFPAQRTTIDTKSTEYLSHPCTSLDSPQRFVPISANLDLRSTDLDPEELEDRTDHTSKLTQQLDMLRKGQSSVVLLHGEKGNGKSALGRWARRHIIGTNIAVHEVVFGAHSSPLSSFLMALHTHEAFLPERLAKEWSDLVERPLRSWLLSPSDVALGGESFQKTSEYVSFLRHIATNYCPLFIRLENLGLRQNQWVNRCSNGESRDWIFRGMAGQKNAHFVQAIKWAGVWLQHTGDKIKIQQVCAVRTQIGLRFSHRSEYICFQPAKLTNVAGK